MLCRGKFACPPTRFCIIVVAIHILQVVEDGVRVGFIEGTGEFRIVVDGADGQFPDRRVKRKESPFGTEIHLRGKVRAEPGDDIVFGEVLWRVLPGEAGFQGVVMPRDMYDERIRENRPQLFGWDVQDAYGVEFSDLEEVRIRNAVRLGVAGGRLNASAEGDSVISLLNKFNLLNNGKLSQAAVMLFARKSRYYPQLLLRMARFRGLDKNEFIDNRQATGNFFDLLDAGMDFCFKHLNLHGKIVGVRRVETLEIPQEALREALINALCHRDYNNIHAAVSLAIYDDRVEIINPGTLPPDLTIEKLNLPHASSPRNLLIAQVLYRTTFIESWGSGVRRMTEVCVANGVKAPVFSVQDNNFAITFYYGSNRSVNVPENIPEDVPENRKSIIVSLIRENKTITMDEMAERCKVNVKTVKRDIEYLKQKGIIVRIGPDRGGYWRVEN